MPSRLILEFLGLPQVHLGDRPIATDRRKAIALLAYLAVNDAGHGRQRYSRESLSALFWPDYEQTKAFTNLRRTIWDLHQMLGKDWLVAGRESVHLNEGAAVDLDVAQFQDLLFQSRQQTESSLQLPPLIEAVKLYRNHFLTGFSLKNAYPFNEWMFAESEELRQQLLEALSLLTDAYCTLGQAEKAIPHARRLTTLDPLNESAHRQLMEVYIQAGQHNAALKQYQTCEQLLRKELNLDPQPETRALYKKLLKREIKPLQVEKQMQIVTPRHNLPEHFSTFVGREKEQSEILSLLEKNRLVTLAGVGGIGKTRLSLYVGQKLLNHFPDGVWFIPLDSLSNPMLVSQTVASIFDIREGPDRPVIEILVNVLRTKILLLILDNCEHLLDNCAQLISRLLLNCPNLKILTTSREILDMEGEAAYYLPSLSIPEEGVALEKLSEYESIQLFAERATLALPSFTLTEENAQTILDICRKVDGIPLAIELAAAYVHILRVEEILKQLDDSFTILAGNNRRTLQRHQTLQASMDWSWGLLSQAEQVFLRQVSIFAGGWTLESAQAVCDGNVLQLISALVKKSLVVVDQNEGRVTRYRFHKIVRQYSLQRLIESGEEKSTRTRHLQYFFRLSEQAELALKGPTQTQWHVHLNDERDNLRAALEWADKTDLQSGLYLSGRLQIFWESLDLSEGLGWLEFFLDKPESISYPCARAKALYTRAMLLYWRQQFSLSHVAAQECLDLYRVCGDKFGEIDGLRMLAESEDKWNHETIELCQQALDLSRALGDPWRQAQVLAIFAWNGNDYPRRISFMKEAVALFKKVGDLQATTEYMIVVGEFEMLNGDPQSAQKWLQEAVKASQSFTKVGVKQKHVDLDMDGIIALSQQLTNNSWLAYILQIYGRIAFACGDFEEAYTALHKSIEIGQELGHRMVYFWSRTHLGYLLLQQGDVIEARDTFVDAALNFQKDQNVIGVVFSLEGMASLFVVTGKYLHAAWVIGWADAMRKRIDDMRPPLEQADVNKIIAACLAKMGEVAFSDAYDEGQKMTLDEAVEYALREK